MRNEPVNVHRLEAIDKALQLVGGSFAAGAKLLDMEPQRFRNLVNYHEPLKRKWGKRRGRPSEKLGFRIVPASEPMPEMGLLVGLAQLIGQERVQSLLEGEILSMNHAARTGASKV